MMDIGEKDLSIYKISETMLSARMAILNGIVVDICWRSGDRVMVVEFWGLIIGG